MEETVGRQFLDSMDRNWLIIGLVGVAQKWREYQGGSSWSRIPWSSPSMAVSLSPQTETTEELILKGVKTWGQRRRPDTTDKE